MTETARVSKEVIAAYYGEAPEKSYFAGCSNGGRQANMEAWKYPEDFDGIISGCPSLYTAENLSSWAWTTQGQQRAGRRERPRLQQGADDRQGGL